MCSQSEDGLTWHVASEWAYSLTVQYTDGSSHTFAKRARPQLALDPHTGEPIALFNGAANPDGVPLTIVAPVG